MIKKIYLVLILSVCCILLTSCEKEEIIKEVSISFNTNVAIGEHIIIKAFNVPENIKSIVFDFGDGTIISGKEIVNKTYNSEGKYTINLNIETEKGNSINVNKNINVEGIGFTRLMEELKTNKKILIMAHRGNTNNKSIPENSISAVHASINAGIDVMEIDTHLTKDGHVVICHDETITRTTNGIGKISELTLAEIKQFRLKDRNGVITNETMPTLEEILIAGRGKILFNLDYSPRTAGTADVYRVVQTCNMVDRVLFYTGGKTNMTNEVFALSDNKAHPYPWGGSVSNYQQCIDMGRSFFVQLDQTQIGSDVLATCQKNGMVVSINVLTYEFENDFISGDFTLINEMIDSNARMIQTDIGNLLINYLKVKGKR